MSVESGGHAACKDRLLRDIVFSLAGGINIYSMFEAGFGGGGNQPFPCGSSSGSFGGTYGECAGGLSVYVCELHLAATCNECEILRNRNVDLQSSWEFVLGLICYLLTVRSARSLNIRFLLKS